MKKQKRPQKSKTRRILRFFVILILLPIILWVGLNLLFASSWGADLVAKRLEKKLEFPCRIDRLSWTPWSGGHAEGFRVLVPVNVGPGGEEALVSVRSARVWPDWDDFWNGELDFTSLDVEGVEMTISLETLKDLNSGRLRGISMLPSETKTVTKNPDPLPAQTSPEPAKNPTPPRNPSPPDQAAPQPAPAAAPEPEKIPADHFIHVTNLNLRVLGASNEILFSIENLALDLPLGGSEVDGHLLFSALKVAGKTVLENESIPLQCQGRKIMLETKRSIFGISAHLQALIALEDSLPLFMEIELPKQPAHFNNLPFGFPSFKMEEIQQRHVFQGLVLQPTSWMATSLGTYRNVTAHDPEDGSEFVFQRGIHAASLRNGVVHATDFRFIGEEDSVLGNGQIFMNGQFRAVVRLVTSDEHGREHDNRVKGMSQGSNENLQLVFQPLGVPERVFHDLHLEGDVRNPMVDMGTDKKDVPLIDVLETLFFVDLSAIKALQ